MKITRFMTGPIQTNAYLAVDEDTNKGFIVDPGYYCPELTEKVRSENIDITYIMLTHGHGDHIGGLKGHLKDFPDAKVVAYAEEREMLTNPAINLSFDVSGEAISFEADIYVKDRDRLQVGNTEITLIHTPGHTKGGMCLYAKGNLFCGDTIFRRSIGRTDFYGGDFRVLMNSIRDRIYTLPDDTVLWPGHMEVSTVGEEKRENPFV